MAGGITITGFELPTMEDVVLELETALLASVSPTLDLSSDSPMGQIVAVFARQVVRLWEVQATLYGSVNPNEAEGILLDNICALIGVVRKAATHSTVTCTLSLNPLVTVPAGSLIAVAGLPNLQYQLVSGVTSVGAGPYSGIFQAVDAGPVPGNAGTLTVIVTPVSGWLSVTNPLDAELGRLIETDTELRIRRSQELTRGGASTADAIRADVLAVDKVLQCKVFENTDTVTDADGVPAHAFEVVVWDGEVPDASDTAIIDAIFASKPAGIRAHGTISQDRTDASGNVIPVGFSRATAVDVFVDLTLSTNSDFDSVNGPDAVRDLLVAKGNSLEMGDDVVSLVLRAVPLTQKGVEDVPVYFQDDADPPLVSGNINITSRQIARFDTSRVDVTVT